MIFNSLVKECFFKHLPELITTSACERHCATLSQATLFPFHIFTLKWRRKSCRDKIVFQLEIKFLPWFGAKNVKIVTFLSAPLTVPILMIATDTNQTIFFTLNRCLYFYHNCWQQKGKSNCSSIFEGSYLNLGSKFCKFINTVDSRSLKH